MTANFGRISLAATVVACTIATSQAQVAQSNANLSRLDFEAQKIFKVVVAAEPSLGRCRYGTDWDRRKLDAYEKWIARVEVGLTPQVKTGDFRTIIDPDHHADATVFCTAAELRSYTAERVAEFEAGSERFMQIDRTLFGYPFFNRSKSKAVVVVTRLALDGRRRSDGRTSRLPGGTSVVAQEYRKVGGRWRFLRSTLLGIT